MPEDNSERFKAIKVGMSNAKSRLSFITTNPLIEFESSVTQRTGKSKEDVVQELKSSGFKETGSLLDGKVGYYENNNGINLTVVETRRGSALFPSGPVRGELLGENAVSINILDE